MQYRSLSDGGTLEKKFELSVRDDALLFDKKKKEPGFGTGLAATYDHGTLDVTDRDSSRYHRQARAKLQLHHHTAHRLDSPHRAAFLHATRATCHKRLLVTDNTQV